MDYISTLERLERSVERLSKKSIEYLRNTPVDQRRRDVEKEHGEPMEITGVETEIIYVLGSPVKIIKM